MQGAAGPGLPQVSALHRAIFCLFLFLTASSPWQPHQLSSFTPDSASRSMGIWGVFFPPLLTPISHSGPIPGRLPASADQIYKGGS